MQTMFDTETQLLGALLLSPDQLGYVLTQVTDRDFHDMATVAVFQAIRAAHAHGKVNAVTVVVALRESGWLDVIGGPAAIVQLMANTHTVACAGPLSDALAASRQRRFMTAAATACGGSPTPEEVESLLSYVLTPWVDQPESKGD
jgi:replicative DNA helicase